MAGTSYIKIIDEGLRALLFTKFKDVLGISNYSQDTAFLPKDIALRKVAEGRGKVSVEFINLWRKEIGIDYARQTTPLARRGIFPDFIEPVNKTDIESVKSVAVKLEYDVWLWSRDLDKLIDAVDIYLFWKHTDPNLNLMLNGEYPLEFDLHFGGVRDDSTLSELFDKGLYFVTNFTIGVDGWIFSTGSIKSVKKIVVSVYDEGVDGDVLMQQDTFIPSEVS